MALYSNALSVVRQYLSSAVGDLIMGTADSGSTTTLVDTMLRKKDDFYRAHGYECYIYEGTNIGKAREVASWQKGSNTLTLAPAFTSSIDSTSKYELHHIFTEDDYRKAINMAIEYIANKYLIYLKDQTTIRLTSTTDNLSNTVYTWEYSLPTSFMYLDTITTEESTSGYKLTGTVSGTFTDGETVTGGTSGATGEFAYQNSGSTYIRVRKVSGSFEVGETATGGTSSETCSSISAVTSEVAGMDRWLEEDTIDPRIWSIIRAYPPKLVLDKRYYTLNEDLYLQLEGQGAQAIVDDDTDTINIPPTWLVQKAITFLPKSKLASDKLDDTYRQALILAANEPKALPHPRARGIVE